MDTHDIIDHIAIPVKNITRVVEWYKTRFTCELIYQDDTWAMLRFGNIKLAFVLPAQHPPHLGFFRSDADAFGTLKTHRDGTRSTYIQDSEGNSVEILAVSRDLLK